MKHGDNKPNKSVTLHLIQQKKLWIAHINQRYSKLYVIRNQITRTLLKSTPEQLLCQSASNFFYAVYADGIKINANMSYMIL